MTAPRLAEGVWGIVATPFRQSTGEPPVLALDALRRLVTNYRDAGADGLTVLGVFGEGASLTLAEQRDVLATVRDVVPELPLVVGTSARSAATVIEQARNALSVVTPVAVMVQLPVSQPAALIEHLRAVHAATGVPLVLQDYPAASGVTIGPEALADVVEALGPIVAGVKAEAAPSARVIRVLTGRVSVPVFGGLGGVGLLDELDAGAAGAMTGFSYPEALVATVAAFRRGGFAEARDVYARWLPLAVFEFQPGVGLAIRKEMLRRRGLLNDGAVRSPAASLPGELMTAADAHFAVAERELALLREVC